MSEEQWASSDGGPEMMLGDVDSMRPWTAQNGPADEYEYVEFVKRFGGSALTPEGKLKQPGDFSDPVFGQAAKVVYETGSLPREMRRAVAQRKHELGMLAPAQVSKAGRSTAQGGDEVQELWPDSMDPMEDGFHLRLGGEDFLFGADAYNNRRKDLTEGFYAGVDGMIPVFDFLEDRYNTDSWGVDASKQMGGATRDIMISAGSAPGIVSWLKNPKLYEIGARTLPDDVFQLVRGLADDPVALGRELVRRFGTQIPQGGLRAYVKTIPKGLTPPGYPVVAGAVHGADVASERLLPEE